RYERGDSRRDPRPAVLDADAPERKITHVPVKIDERRAWLTNRPAEEKLALQRKFDRFLALSQAAQASLHELDTALANEDYKGPLSNVLLRYSDWLDTQLSLADRGALEDMTVEKKVDYVQRRMTRVFAFYLTRWLHEYGQRHEAELRELTAADTRESPS